MKRFSFALSTIAATLYFFLYLPLIAIVLLSFNSSKYGSSWQGPTLQWYSQAFSNEQIRIALKNTCILAFCSTLVSTFLGSLLGYGLERHSQKGKKLISSIMMLPVAIPDIVMAVALLLFYALVRRWTGFLELGLSTMILAHVTFQIPFVAAVVRARLHGIPPELEEAAYDLGADRWQRLRYVTLPILFPSIFAGALLSFTLSLDDFVVSFFTSGAGSTTLPIYIYSSVKRGVSGEIHALSTLIIIVAILATITLTFLNQRERK
jgi:spermidine/putrescine transport system permease protein